MANDVGALTIGATANDHSDDTPRRDETNDTIIILRRDADLSSVEAARVRCLLCDTVRRNQTFTLSASVRPRVDLSRALPVAVIPLPLPLPPPPVQTLTETETDAWPPVAIAADIYSYISLHSRVFVLTNTFFFFGGGGGWRVFSTDRASFDPPTREKTRRTLPSHDHANAPRAAARVRNGSFLGFRVDIGGARRVQQFRPGGRPAAHRLTLLNGTL